MLSFIALVAAFILYIYRAFLLISVSRMESRRGLSGCDVARTILDMRGFSPMSIEAAPKSSQNKRGLKTLMLDSATHASKDLHSIARAAWDAVSETRAGKKHLSLEAEKSLHFWLGIVIILLWVSMGVAMTSPAFSLAADLAKGALAAIFIFSLLSLQGTFDNAKETYASLRQSQYFELKELTTLRKIVGVLRLERATLIYGAVFDPILSFASFPHGVRRG